MFATVALGDHVKGITSTLITVGDDASQFTSSAELTGEANASNVNALPGVAAAFATAGSGIHVSGLENSSIVTVGGSLTAGLTATGTTTLTANATNVDSRARAIAGDSGSASDVTGIQDSDITVGEDAGTITGRATGTFNATASSTGETAVARAGGELDGARDSTVTIGDDGNLTAVGSAVANSTATTVGDGTDDSATAETVLDVNGLDQASDSVTIGSMGNVIAQGSINGNGSASSVAGLASTTADLDVDGIDLGPSSSNIAIGEVGDITGLGVIGTLTSEGGLDQQVVFSATSTQEDAVSTGSFDVTGIIGTQSVHTITAGPNDGDVTGQALSGVNVSASTTGNASGDDATATINSSSIAGVQGVNILGGMVGTNSVKGTSLGDFDVSAISVAGNATGSSNVDAYGIYDSGNNGTISLSGNIQALAQLSNSVTSRTVSGNAVATATGDAIGLGGYSINIIGSGSLMASANNTNSSITSSVGGRAMA